MSQSSEMRPTFSPERGMLGGSVAPIQTVAVRPKPLDKHRLVVIEDITYSPIDGNPQDFSTRAEFILTEVDEEPIIRTRAKATGEWSALDRKPDFAPGLIVIRNPKVKYQVAPSAEQKKLDAEKVLHVRFIDSKNYFFILPNSSLPLRVNDISQIVVKAAGPDFTFNYIIFPQ